MTNYKFIPLKEISEYNLHKELICTEGIPRGMDPEWISTGKTSQPTLTKIVEEARKGLKVLLYDSNI